MLFLQMISLMKKIEMKIFVLFYAMSLLVALGFTSLHAVLMVAMISSVFLVSALGLFEQ